MSINPDLNPRLIGARVTRVEDRRMTGSVLGGGSTAIVAIPIPIRSPALGTVKVLSYTVIEDCGRVINPLIVEGQVHGGTAHSLGGALLEELIYDDGGQLMTSTFADHLLPSMTDVPSIEVHQIETLSPLTPLGNKGMGEAGAIGPMAAIGNAVADALDRCVEEVPLPAGTDMAPCPPAQTLGGPRPCSWPGSQLRSCQKYVLAYELLTIS